MLTVTVIVTATVIAIARAVVLPIARLIVVEPAIVSHTETAISTNRLVKVIVSKCNGNSLIVIERVLQLLVSAFTGVTAGY